MILLAIRSRVLGPNLLVIIMRKPASGKLNLGGLELMTSSTITTGFLLYCGSSFTVSSTMPRLVLRSPWGPHPSAGAMMQTSWAEVLAAGSLASAPASTQVALKHLPTWRIRHSPAVPHYRPPHKQPLPIDAHSLLRPKSWLIARVFQFLI